MAQVNFRIDDNTKVKAERACKAMGLSMTTAINIFLTKVANEQRIPFEVSVDPFYSEINQKRIKQAAKELDEGKGTVHEVDYD